MFSLSQLLKRIGFRRIGFLCGVLLASSGCTSDCIYKYAEDSEGDELCYRFCPLEDDQGNVVVDADEFTVYEREDQVDNYNCEALDLSASTGASTSTTTTTQ